MPELVNAYLRREHDFLTEFIVLLRREMAKLREGALPDAEKFKNILRFCRNFIDVVHHKKEEELLFVELYPIENIEAGPNCVYYKDLQLQKAPVVEQIKEILQDMGKDSSQLYEQWRSFIREGHIINPLLEEHVLGRHLLNFIEFEVDQRLKGLRKDNNLLIYALYRYVSMLEEHIDKENNCFSYTVDKYLDTELQKKIVIRFTEYDEGPARDTIQEARDFYKLLLHSY